MRHLFACVLSCLLATACDSGSSAPDAAPGQPDAPPATPDATPKDAPPAQPITVTVFDQAATGATAAEVAVEFHNPDGTIDAEVLTDGSGVATHLLPLGGHVSVIYPGDPMQVVTIIDARPGDQLSVGPVAQPTLTSKGTMTIGAPGTFAGASCYLVDLGCTTVSAGDVPATIVDVPSTCPDPMAVQMFAQDAAFQTLAFTSKPSVAFMDGGTSTLGPWRTDFLDQVVTMTNHTTGAPTQLDVFAVADGLHYGAIGGAFDSALLVMGMPSSVTAHFGQGFADTYETRVTVYDPQIRPSLIVHHTATPTTLTVDAVADFLPFVDAPSYDAATNTVAWTAQGALGTTDGAELLLSWPLDGGGATVGGGIWRVILPPGRMSQKLPDLPAALAGNGPGNAAGTVAGTTFVIEADFLAGYDALRPLAGRYLLETVPYVDTTGGLPIESVTRAVTSRSFD
jgi:hypothetical protein